MPRHGHWRTQAKFRLAIRGHVTLSASIASCRFHAMASAGHLQSDVLRATPSTKSNGEKESCVQSRTVARASTARSSSFL